MAFDRFPGATGGNAHLLVIITGGAAGREGIVQPEAGILCQPVGRVGEGRSALVGGDDEVGIVSIEPQRIGRRDNLLANNVVGDGEERADIGLVGLCPHPEDFLARAAGRQQLGEKAAFGAHGHDDRILDLLRLDEPQHLRPVILRPVRPAEAPRATLPKRRCTPSTSTP